MEFVLSILPYVAPVLLGFFALIGLIAGLIRGCWSSVLVFIKNVIAVVVAIFVSPILISVLSSALKKLLMPVINFSGFMNDIPKTTAALEALFNALFSVLIFTLVFLLALFILSLIFIAFIKPIRKLEQNTLKKKAVSRLLGGVLGILTGALVCIAISMPVFGLSHTCRDVLVSVNSWGEKTPEIVEQNNDKISDGSNVFSALLDNTAADIMWKYGQKTIYNMTASIKTENGKTNLDAEVQKSVRLVQKCLSLFDRPITEFGDTEIQNLKDFILNFDYKKDVFLPEVVSGLLNDISDKWLNRESFFGLKPFGLDEDSTRQLFVDIYTIFSKTTPKNLFGELQTITDIFEILQKNQLLAISNNMDALFETAYKNGVLDEIKNKVSANPDTSVL
ncbi:MAG: CvpA family protein, partial [Oscillospiraceae bacterium]|nr:CvpA family protein [Oscillospiraceae bacterium]